MDLSLPFLLDAEVERMSVCQSVAIVGMSGVISIQRQSKQPFRINGGYRHLVERLAVY